MYLLWTQKTMKRRIDKAFKSNTKAVFGETLANPALLAVLDIEKFAKIAHKHHVPFIVDNTFSHSGIMPSHLNMGQILSYILLLNIWMDMRFSAAVL